MRKRRPVFIAGLTALALAVAGFLVYWGCAARANGFLAGELHIELGGGSSSAVPAAFAVDNAKPGDTGGAVVNLTNAQTSPSRVTMRLENVVNEPGKTPEPEPLPDSGELGDNVLLTVRHPSGNILAAGTVNGLAGRDLTLFGSLPAGTAGTVYIDYQVPSGAGNEIQGDRVRFDIVFAATWEEPPPPGGGGAPGGGGPPGGGGGAGPALEEGGILPAPVPPEPQTPPAAPEDGPRPAPVPPGPEQPPVTPQGAPASSAPPGARKGPAGRGGVLPATGARPELPPASSEKGITPAPVPSPGETAPPAEGEMPPSRKPCPPRVSPFVYICAGLAAGLGLLLAGWRRRHRRESQAGDL